MSIAGGLVGLAYWRAVGAGSMIAWETWTAGWGERK